MNDKKNQVNEDNLTLFRFCFLLVSIVGIFFLLNGFIRSNFGYPPILDIPETGYRSAVAGNNDNLLTSVMGNKKLHSPWNLPADVRQPNSFIRKLEEKIFEKTNRRRTRRSINSLIGENGLELTARFHSSDMARKGFFDHQNLENVGPSFRVAKIHRRFIGLTGENIFKTTKDIQDPEQAAERIMEGWMNSPGHRENILRSSFDVLGVGCFEHLENNRPWVYATQVFGTSIARLSGDFPDTVKPGQEIPVSVETVHPGYKAPIAVLWVNAADRSRKEKFSLATAGHNIARGKLTAPGDRGLYQLVFHIPIKGKNNTYAICRGPLYAVR